ncbi:MAG: MAPEG family protein [Proteobacteria bacterium]|nr:MAPEG family protein [Pseudomonadota bacterium]
MVWVDIVGLLAVIQLMVFITLVGNARYKYGVTAPATSGHPVFERYFRVQMNTIECLLVLLPGLWLAAKYWPPKYAAIVGAIYLVGRVLYLLNYVRDPAKRSFGYTLSVVPAILLVAAALLGALRTLLQR